MCVVGRSVVEVARPSGRSPLDAGAPWEAVRDELFYERGAPYEDAAEFSYPSPYAAHGAGAGRVRAPVVRPAPAAGRGGGRPDAPDPRASSRSILGATTIATPVTRVLADRRGVCQDFAHLQIGCLRSLGLAARYVSGYLLTDPPPGQPRLVGADASHAWLSVWCPPLGWVDLDPDQRRPAVAAPRDARLGPRLRRRQPAARRRARRPRPHAPRRRQRHAGAGDGPERGHVWRDDNTDHSVVDLGHPQGACSMTAGDHHLPPSVRRRLRPLPAKSLTMASPARASRPCRSEPATN